MPLKERGKPALSLRSACRCQCEHTCKTVITVGPKPISEWRSAVFRLECITCMLHQKHCKCCASIVARKACISGFVRFLHCWLQHRKEAGRPEAGDLLRLAT